MEFKAFPKIESLRKIEMTITQKIHGTNAQIFITERQSNLIWLNGGRASGPFSSGNRR